MYSQSRSLRILQVVREAYMGTFSLNFWVLPRAERQVRTDLN